MDVADDGDERWAWRKAAIVEGFEEECVGEEEESGDDEDEEVNEHHHDL